MDSNERVFEEPKQCDLTEKRSRVDHMFAICYVNNSAF